MKQILRIFHKLFYRHDSPDSKFGREWRSIPVVDYSPALCIGWETQLTKWENKIINPKPTSGRYIALHWNIFNWKIGQDHIFYDGPNCSWQIGPLQYYQTGIGNCPKCESNK